MRGMKKRQQGISIVGWLVNLLIISVLLTFAVRMAPHYTDDWAVQDVVNSLSDRVGYDSATVAEVRGWIEQGLARSNIVLDDDAVSVSRYNGVVMVDIDYERRIKFFHNVELVMTFGHNWNAGI